MFRSVWGHPFLRIIGITSVFLLVFLQNWSYSQTLKDRWNLYSEEEANSLSQPQSSPPIFSDLLRTLKDRRRILFISGFSNEIGAWISDYFGTSIEFSKHLGIETEIYHPNSIKSFQQNAVDMYTFIDQYSKKNKEKPPIIIAHSIGGAQALTAILEHPHLILSNKVDRVVLLQAPLRGTPFAVPSHLRFPFNRLASLFQNGRHPTFPIETTQHFDEALNNTYGIIYDSFKNIPTTTAHTWNSEPSKDSTLNHVDEHLDKLSQKIFYVRTYEEPEEQHWSLRLLRWGTGVPMHHLRRSDGIIPTSHQKLRDFGVDLGILKADHISLTHSDQGSLSPGAVRAFTRALLEQIYEDNLADSSSESL